MNIDWALLRKQKEWLMRLATEMEQMPTIWLKEEVQLADGLIHLLEHIQDWNVDQGNATAYEVFGDLDTEVEDGHS